MTRSRTMAELERDVLRILAEANAPVRCGWIGDRLFADQQARGTANAPFARTAGLVVRRLVAAGKVEFVSAGGGWWGYVLKSE